MKRFYRKHSVMLDLLLVAAFMLLLGGYAVAAPAEVLPADSLPLFELLAVLLGSEQAAQWLAVLGLLCYLLTHIIAWLPAQWVAKLPRWLITLINMGAANYRGTKNASDRVTKNTL